MGGFTAEEIKADLDRRARQHTDGHAVDMTEQDKDTTCLHCGNPVYSWQTSDPENPLCDVCL